MADEKQQHYIAVQTGQNEYVQVNILPQQLVEKRGIDGGFIQVFQRIFTMEIYRTLPTCAKDVYFALAFLANNNDEFTVDAAGLRLLELHCGTDHKTISKGLDVLMQRQLVLRMVKGYIVKGGRRVASSYRMLNPVKERLAQHQGKEVHVKPRGKTSSVRTGTHAGNLPAIRRENLRRNSGKTSIPASGKSSSAELDSNEIKQDVADYRVAALRTRKIAEREIPRLIAAATESHFKECIEDFDYRNKIGDSREPGWLSYTLTNPDVSFHPARLRQKKQAIKKTRLDANLQAEREQRVADRLALANRDAVLEALLEDASGTELKRLKAAAIETTHAPKNKAKFEAADPRSDQALRAAMKRVLAEEAGIPI